MEVTPGKLLTFCALLFGGIVALGLVTQAQSTEQLKQSFAGLDLTSLRQRLNREEGIAEPEPQPEQEEATEEG